MEWWIYPKSHNKNHIIEIEIDFLPREKSWTNIQDFQDAPPLGKSPPLEKWPWTLILKASTARNQSIGQKLVYVSSMESYGVWNFVVLCFSNREQPNTNVNFWVSYANCHKTLKTVEHLGLMRRTFHFTRDVLMSYGKKSSSMLSHDVKYINQEINVLPILHAREHVQSAQTDTPMAKHANNCGNTAQDTRSLRAWTQADSEKKRSLIVHTNSVSLKQKCSNYTITRDCRIRYSSSNPYSAERSLTIARDNTAAEKTNPMHNFPIFGHQSNAILHDHHQNWECPARALRRMCIIMERTV